MVHCPMLRWLLCQLTVVRLAVSLVRLCARSHEAGNSGLYAEPRASEVRPHFTPLCGCRKHPIRKWAVSCGGLGPLKAFGGSSRQSILLPHQSSPPAMGRSLQSNKDPRSSQPLPRRRGLQFSHAKVQGSGPVCGQFSDSRSVETVSGCPHLQHGFVPQSDFQQLAKKLEENVSRLERGLIVSVSTMSRGGQVRHSRHRGWLKLASNRLRIKLQLTPTCSS